MKTKLHLNKKQSLNKLNELCKQLSNEKWSFYLDPYLPTTSGETHDDITKHNSTVLIGVSQIEHTNLFKTINDTNFTEALVTLFHECRHTQQFDSFSNQNSSDELAISHLAAHNNISYYRENYQNMTSEIDAEYFGVKNAYDYIQTEYSTEIANDLINDYMYKHRPYIISQNHIYDISDIDTIFESAYNKALHKTKWLSSYQSNDDIIKFLKEKPKYEKAFDKTFDDGYERDKFIAAVELYYHPEYRDFYSSPAIKNLNIENYLEKKRELPYIDIPSQDNQKGNEYE